MALLPPRPKKYKAIIPIGVVFLALFVLAAIYGDRGVVALQRLRTEQRHLESVAFWQQQHNTRLREHLLRLQSDDGYLERWARQRLHYAKPGEIIYRFDAESPAAGRR